jgi:hypothetical protein
MTLLKTVDDLCANLTFLENSYTPRDAAVAEEEARRNAVDLETRLQKSLQALENQLGLVQHKV